MSTSGSQLLADVAQLHTDSELLHAIVNGPARGDGSLVTTGGGKVKTAARAIAEVQDFADSAILGVKSTAATSISAIEAVAAGYGYQVPVPYSAGLSMTNASQTVSYDGQVYAPIQSQLPFTTGSAFEPAKFRLIQGVSGADLSGPNGAAMVGFSQSESGEEVMSVRDRLRIQVFASAFGLKSTNTAAQNSKALQKALDEIHSQDPTGGLGGELLIEPGAFKFGELFPYRAISIRGTGRRVTTLDSVIASGTSIVLADAMEFEGLQFTGAANSTGAIFTQAAGFDNAFRNCWFQDYYKAIVANGTLRLHGVDAFNGAFNAGKIDSGGAVVEMLGGRLLADNFRSNVSSGYGGKLPHPAIRVLGGQEIVVSGHSNIQNMGDAIDVNLSGATSLIDIEINGAILASNSGDAINVTTSSGASIRRLAVIGGNIDTNQGDGIDLSAHTGTMNTLQVVGTRINGSGGWGTKLGGKINNVDIRASYDSNAAGSVSPGAAVITNMIMNSNGLSDVFNMVKANAVAAGTAAVLQATGPDADIPIQIKPKGKGKVQIKGTATNADGGLYIESFAPGVELVDLTTGSTRTRILSDNQSFYVNWDGAADYTYNVVSFRVRFNGNAVNYLSTQPAIAGQPVLVSAEGSDPNISIRLVPKGTGKLRYGTVISTADVPTTGYLEIEDAGGTLRKLAVIG